MIHLIIIKTIIVLVKFIKIIQVLFKDEIKVIILKEFVSLRPKLYACKTLDRTDKKKKVKGVNKYVIRSHMKFDDYMYIQG